MSKWIERDGYSEIRRLFLPAASITALSEGGPPDGLIPHIEYIRVGCSCGKPHEETKSVVLEAMETLSAAANR